MERMRGDRPKRSKSPAGKRNPRRNVPSRRPDPGTEDFIRFVRDFQTNRRPTFTGLQRRVPLPEIGQGLSCGLNDSGFLDKLTDNYDEGALDNELVYANNKVSDPRNDRIIKEVLTITRQQTKDSFISTGKQKQKVTSESLIFTRQKSNLQKSWSLPRTKQSFNTGRSKHSLKQLPPLFQEELPVRPAAPSPSWTPPLDSDESSEDQVEFLDL